MKYITHPGTAGGTGSKYEPKLLTVVAALNPDGIERTPFTCKKRRRLPGTAATIKEDIVIGARALIMSNVEIAKRYSFAELLVGTVQNT